MPLYMEIFSLRRVRLIETAQRTVPTAFHLSPRVRCRLCFQTKEKEKRKVRRQGDPTLGLSYVAGIVPTLKVRAVSKRVALNKRMSVRDLALSLPKHAWRPITWPGIRRTGTQSGSRRAPPA